ADLPRLLRQTIIRARAASAHRRTARVRPPRPILDTTQTVFNRALTPNRSFATVTLRLEDLKQVKSAFDVSLNDVVLGLVADSLADWSEYTPPKPYAWMMRQYGRYRIADRHRPPINLVVSNVPGPRTPLYVAGAKLEAIYSVGPILEGVGLNVTVWSYCDD